MYWILRIVLAIITNNLKVSTSIHQPTQSIAPSQTEPPKLLSLAAQSSLQAMLPSGDQSNTPSLAPGGKPSSMSTMNMQSTSQMAPVPESTTVTSSGAPQSYIPQFSVSWHNSLRDLGEWPDSRGRKCQNLTWPHLKNIVFENEKKPGTLREHLVWIRQCILNFPPS